MIGRDRELAELHQLIREARLVTVTGAGGCGKTRLAREFVVCSAVGSDPGAVFVDLSEFEGSEGVEDACRRALGLRDRSGASAAELIIERLRDRETVLVLDNCEHVAGAAALLAKEVLAGTASRILATSRVPLGLGGETRFVLSPLSLPEGDGLLEVLRSDAARMFLDIASVVDPGLELDRTVARAVAQICRKLDGLPLALVLAAARAGEMAVHEIAGSLSLRGPLSEGLADGELRQHRSIRASLEWSSELLEPRDRRLMRRLAVFTGGWTATAARAVCASRDEDGEVLAGLGRLEAAGLIVPHADTTVERWTFLSTVGEYAREQMERAGERATLRRRHQSWARELSERADELLVTEAGRAELEREAANFASALELTAVEDAGAAVTIVAGLARHWILAERLKEGRRSCAVALDVAASVPQTGARAILHCAAALIAVLGEDYPEALTQVNLGLPLAAGTDPATEGRCLQMASMVQILTGSEFERGLANAHRAAELMRLAADQVGLAMALVNIAQAEGLCEQFDGIRRAYDGFLKTTASDHPRLRAWAEVSIAWAELITGSPRAALKHAELALALEGDWPSMTHFVAVCHRLHALALLGRADEARTAGTQAMERARAAGVGMAVPAISVALAIAHAAAGDLDSAELLATDLLQLPQMHTRALMSELLVRISLERGEHRQAASRLLALEQLAEGTRSRRLTAVCEQLCGRVAAQAGDAVKARALLQSALAYQAQAGQGRAAAETLEELALVTPLDIDPARRPRLAAAAMRARREIGCPPSAATLGRLHAARERFAARFGETIWEDAWADGEAITLQAAISYARRARGPRGGSQSGWGALTPTEAEVAQLAAAGLSNPEIARRLFMSRGTVKSHLAKVYAKLEVANRTQLATVAVLDSP